jgi:integrase
MRGSVVKRGNGYSVVLDLGRDEHDRRIRKWHSGYRTRRDAERARIELLAAVQGGSYVEPSRLDVRSFLVDRWLPAHRGRVRPRTYAIYLSIVNGHVVPALGHLPLQQLGPDHLDGLYAALAANKGLSAASIRNVHVTVRRALADAVRWGRIARNPAEAASPPARQRTEMQTWSAGELRAFLESVRGDRLSALWLLASTTGMRRGELLGLRWSAVDLPAARLSVVEAKTQAGRRSIALDPGTVASLKAWRKAQVAERLAWGGAYATSGRVFTREDGAPIAARWLNKRFVRLQQLADARHIRLHDLRHTWATLALQAGVHVKVVSERLGHSSIAVTLDIYSHVIPAMQEDAAATVAALVLGSLGGEQ